MPRVLVGPAHLYFRYSLATKIGVFFSFPYSTKEILCIPVVSQGHARRVLKPHCAAVAMLMVLVGPQNSDEMV